jgi:hypothetical protein
MLRTVCAMPGRNAVFAYSRSGRRSSSGRGQAPSAPLFGVQVGELAPVEEAFGPSRHEGRAWIDRC